MPISSEDNLTKRLGFSGADSATLRAGAASVGILAMLGTGERADMMAHATGLGFGLIFGVLMGRYLRREVRLSTQAICLGATIATVASAWLLAFKH